MVAHSSSYSSPLQNQLRRRLIDKGISANALEKRAGLKPSAVQNILQGKSKHPGAGLLQAIASELGCSVVDLLGNTAPQESPPHAHKPTTSDWNSKMYIDAIHTVEGLLDQRKIIFTKDTVLKYADEVYKYSMHGPTKSIDIHFATWLIDQYPFQE